MSQSSNGSSGKKDFSQSTSRGSDSCGGQDSFLDETPNDANETSNDSSKTSISDFSQSSNGSSGKKDLSQSISQGRDSGGGQDSFVNETQNEVNKMSNDSSSEENSSTSTTIEEKTKGSNKEINDSNLDSLDFNLDGNRHHTLDSLDQLCEPIDGRKRKQWML